jgi:hypothetical protein
MKILVLAMLVEILLFHVDLHAVRIPLRPLYLRGSPSCGDSTNERRHKIHYLLQYTFPSGTTFEDAERLLD